MAVSNFLVFLANWVRSGRSESGLIPFDLVSVIHFIGDVYQRPLPVSSPESFRTRIRGTFLVQVIGRTGW